MKLKGRCLGHNERDSDLVVGILGLLVVEASGLLVVTRLGVQGRSLKRKWIVQYSARWWEL